MVLTTEQASLMLDKALRENYPDDAIEYGEGWELLATIFFELGQDTFSTSDLDLTVIYVWPNGVWCEADELETMGHMSDDYTLVHLTEREWLCLVGDTQGLL